MPLFGCRFCGASFVFNSILYIAGFILAVNLIVVAGGFFYHLLFEAKSQYILPYFIVLIPMAAVGLNELYVLIKNKQGVRN